MAASVKVCSRVGVSLGLLLLGAGSPVYSLNYAGDVFSLADWILTIPIDDDGDGLADEVVMPTLRNFEDPDFFHLSGTGDSIVFRADCDDATPLGTEFPRCQLRELKRGTKTLAQWGSGDGLVHNLTITAAFHGAPEANPHVVVAGIYEGEKEIVTVALEGHQLLLTRDGLDPLVLQEEYVMGTPFELMVIIDHKRARAFFSNAQIAEWPLENDALHYRAGCEVQSTPSLGDGAEQYGEVEIRALYITHGSS